MRDWKAISRFHASIVLLSPIIQYRGEAELRITCYIKMYDYDYQQMKDKSKVEKKTFKKNRFLSKKR